MKNQNIISDKPDHTHLLHIYEEKGHWYANKNSTRFIKQLQKEYEKMKLLVNNSCSNTDDKIEVNFETIINKFTIIRCSDTEMILKIP